MNNESRWATGNKVEIIDSGSSNFGKTGVLMGPILVTMINAGSQPIRPRTEYHWKVKLDDTGAIETFAPYQLKKIQ